MSESGDTFRHHQRPPQEKALGVEEEKQKQ
jgi:hypothetical protein